MPKIEVDELDFKENAALRQLYNSMLANPKARKTLEQAMKLADPNAKTPLLDAEAELIAPVVALQKKLDDLEAERAKEKSEREQADKLARINGDIESGVAQLRASGWTEEGIAGVRKLMEEKGILDVSIAAAAFEKDHPPPTPAAPRGSGAWNFTEGVEDGEADLKRLLDTQGKLESVADKMARDALNEVRGQGPRR